MNVTGCLNAGSVGIKLPGALVVIVQSSVTIFSGTTDVNGQVMFSAATGVSCSYTISFTGLTTKTGSFTPTGTTFTASTVGTTPQTAGFHCTQCCPNPFPTTLNGTTPLGAMVMTFATSLWVGCIDDAIGTVNGSCAPASGNTGFGMQFAATGCVGSRQLNARCCAQGGPTLWLVSPCTTGPFGATPVTVQCSPIVITYVIPTTFHATDPTPVPAFVCTTITDPMGGTSTFTP